MEQNLLYLFIMAWFQLTIYFLVTFMDNMIKKKKKKIHLCVNDDPKQQICSMLTNIFWIFVNDELHLFVNHLYKWRSKKKWKKKCYAWQELTQMNKRGLLLMLLFSNNDSTIIIFVFFFFFRIWWNYCWRETSVKRSKQLQWHYQFGQQYNK